MEREASLLRPEALAMIGYEAPPSTGYPVTEHEIRRYCYAIDDLNPLYLDAESAARGPYGGLIAPPLYVTVPFADDVPLEQLRGDGIPLSSGGVPRPPLKSTRSVAGGTEVEFFHPVRPGDTLTRRRWIRDIYERRGQRGPLVFVVTETEYRNQRGELVAREQSYNITF